MGCGVNSKVRCSSLPIHRFSHLSSPRTHSLPFTSLHFTSPNQPFFHIFIQRANFCFSLFLSSDCTFIHLETMAFILSAMLQACKIKPDPEPQVIAIPSTAPATMTKGAGDGEVEALIAQVLDLHQELDAHRHDLTPCDNINNLFGKLVGICTRTIGEAVTDQVRPRNPAFSS